MSDASPPEALWREAVNLRAAPISVSRISQSARCCPASAKRFINAPGGAQDIVSLLVSAFQPLCSLDSVLRSIPLVVVDISLTLVIVHGGEAPPQQFGF